MSMRFPRKRITTYAGREITCVEAVVETERDGRVDMSRQAMERLPSVLEPMTVQKTIRNLEIDANRFWVLNESQWLKLSKLLGVSMEDAKAALYRAPGDA